MSDKKVLLVVTSVSKMNSIGDETGFWLSELTHPYYTIRDNGFQVDIVSISGGKAPVDPKSFDLTDPLNKKFMEDKTLSKDVEDTKVLKDVSAKDYAAIIFAGGHGTMWDFPKGEGVEKVSNEIYENGGIIAAICHGPAAFINLKGSDGEHLIKDKRIAAFSNIEEEIVGLTKIVPFSLEDKLKECGCKYIEGKEWTSNVQVDTRIVTGQNPQSAKEVGEEVVKLLKER